MTNVNKQQLIDAIHQQVDSDQMSKADVERVVEAFTDTVTTELRSGNSVRLVGFGTFEPRKKKATTARNPQTGAAVKVPARTVPAFKPGQGMKDEVNKSGRGGAKKASAKKSSKKAAKKSAKKSPAKKSAKKAAKKSAKKTGKKAAKKR